MEHGTTTPVSAPHQHGLITKSLIVASAVMMVVSIPIGFAGKNASADQYDTQIRAIEKQIDRYESEAGKLGKEVKSLESQLKKLTIERNSIIAELKLTQTKFDKLTAQIETAEQEILENQDALGDTLADLYILGRTTPLEMLTSSRNVGDFIDKQAYQNSIRQELVKTIAEVESLKIALENDRKEVEKVLVRQKAQENSLAAKEAEQRSLIATTRNQQTAYAQLVGQTQQRLKSVSERQREYYRNSGGATSGVIGDFRYSNFSGNVSCGGGYPSKWCVGQDTVVDDWQLWNRECVSYVAWALEKRFGKYVAGFNGQGNAEEWPSSAVRFSGASIVSKPKPGDAVILPASGDFAPIGHAMIVEEVNGSNVKVSQYNFYGTGQYSTMDIGTGGVYFIRFQDK